MSKLTSIVVDDEELARTLIENYVDRLPHVELKGSYTNPIKALTAIQSAQIDLIFLDIQMPEMTGTDFIQTLAGGPMVIFTTAYSEYALDGYELNAVDYLLKPFSFERFVQAVNKVTELKILKQESPATAPTELSNTFEEKNYILVRADHKVHKIPYAEIYYIQSMREYVAYYTTSGRILSLNSLKKLEEVLPAEKFVRIHKSYMISKAKAKVLEGNMVHIGDEKIPIGASYREKVMKYIF